MIVRLICFTLLLFGSLYSCREASENAKMKAKHAHTRSNLRHIYKSISSYVAKSSTLKYPNVDKYNLSLSKLTLKHPMVNGEYELVYKEGEPFVPSPNVPIAVDWFIWEDEKSYCIYADGSIDLISISKINVMKSASAVINRDRLQ